MAKLYFLDQELYISAYQLSTKNNKAKTNHVIYSFHDQVLRPFWTYLADKHNYKFHLINYASGHYGFKDQDGFYPTIPCTIICVLGKIIMLIAEYFIIILKR